MQGVGIYKITVGDRFYYGQGKTLARRARSHLRLLKKGQHFNHFMQYAYDKHQSYDFTVLAYCDVEDLDFNEQLLLDEYHGAEDCMNISRYSDAPRRGRTFSPLSSSHKAKISEGMKGGSHPSARRVLVIHPDGTEHEFACGPEAAAAYGVSYGTMKHWATGRRSQPGSKTKPRASIAHLRGYTFRYL